MNKIMSIIVAVMIACMALSACGETASDVVSDVSSDIMSTDGAVTDGDGYIGNESGTDKNDTANAMTQPTVTDSTDTQNDGVDMNDSMAGTDNPVM